MDIRLFSGELVRLAAIDPESDAEIVARWSRDSEYWRLISPAPALPRTAQAVRQNLEEEPSPTGFEFAIRTLAEDRFIGEVGLWVDGWAHEHAWLGIHIGERDYWGKGYGTDAIRLILRYGFTELGLRRVSLSVLATNARAIRAYEKVGFVVEGRTRHTTRYDGRWLDDVFMGILREEWEVKREA